jgi:hypothetical protein
MRVNTVTISGIRLTGSEGGSRMVTKEDIHRLIEELPEDDLPAAALYLRNLGRDYDPLLRALANAPEDDEAETPEEAEAVAEGKAALARGEVRSLAEIRAEYRRKP